MENLPKPIHPKFASQPHPSFGAPTGYSATGGSKITSVSPLIIPQPYQMTPTISLGGYVANPNCVKCHGTGLTPKGSKCHKCFHY